MIGKHAHLWKQYPYPINIVIYITERVSFLECQSSFDPLNPPADFAATVEYLLKRLSQRDAYIMQLGFGGTEQGVIPFQTIADDYFQVSRSRIEQIVSRSIRRMTANGGWEMLTLGISGYVQFCKEQARADISAALDKQRAAILTEYEATSDVQEAIYRSKLKAMPLYTLALHTGVEAVLRSAGYKTVFDVVNAGPRKIRFTKEIGVKRYAAVVSALDTIGVDVTEWRALIENRSDHPYAN